MKSHFHQASKSAKTVEIRLDYLAPEAVVRRSPSEGNYEEFLNWLENRRVSPSIIATCRRLCAGGRFLGNIHAQFGTLKVLEDARLCQWVDLELESLVDYRHGFLRTGFPNAGILLSYHNFEETTRKLLQIVRRLDSFRVDAIKIATQCNSYADLLRVLALCKGRRNVIAVPMGEIGLPARVLALRHGSALAYAAVGEKTAAGQLTLEEMKYLYRADKLDRRSRVYGVIGNPVSHSLSPLLHNTGFIARGMNDVYLPFLVPDLRDFLRAVEPLGMAGFSVTLPHKQAILRHLDDCDPLAEAIGAVNTVVVRGKGKLYGYNTDYVGVLRALQKRVALRGSRVLIFGAGGAARATVFALAQEGAIVNICARRPAEARKLARAAGGEAIERRHLRREFFDAIVNATPIGMHPHANESPLAASELNCRLVFDSVYRPMKTRLLRLAGQRGIETVSGVEMFVAQGAAQWEIWTGLRAPEKPMRAAVLAKLKGEESIERQKD